MVIRQEACSRLRVVMAMRGDRIAATLGPWVVHRVGLSAVFGPLLFGHASGLQGSTCRPAVTVGNEPGGADGVGLPCWSEQQQSLKGKQNKKVLWCHGLRGLVWKASGCALSIPTRSMNSDSQLMTPYSAACDLDHTPGALLKCLVCQ